MAWVHSRGLKGTGAGAASLSSLLTLDAFARLVAAVDATAGTDG